MSAYPPKADIAQPDWHVRYVPQPDLLSFQARREPTDHDLIFTIGCNAFPRTGGGCGSII